MLKTIVSLFVSYAACSPTVIVPDLGTLIGRSSTLTESLAFFGGIPYAKAPLDDLRWQSPQPYGSWSSPRDASSFGLPCFGSYAGQAAALNVTESEDCLFLNVFAPAASLHASQKAPVLFWIHGGGYTKGSSEFHLYQGDEFVAKATMPTLMVSMNYRLNAFGFLGSRALQHRSVSGGMGNFGIEDQRLALAWVYDHIVAFGGNRNQITIFGESAGGNSVLNHLSQPASFKFYAQAIVQSGSYQASVTLDEAEDTYALLLGNSSCGTDLGCLLKLPACTVEKIARHIEPLGATWGPVIDGISLVADPQHLIAQGRYNSKVPVIIGSNRDESAFWAVTEPHNMTEHDLDEMINASFPPAAFHEIKRLYMPSAYPYPADLGNYSIWWWTSMRIQTDGKFGLGHCSVRSVARNLVAGGTPSVYVYLFAHAPQSRIIAYPGDEVPAAGPGNVLVPHMSEVPYVFNRLELLNSHAGERELSTAVAARWAHFAHFGNPNVAGQPALRHWPKYTSSTDYSLRFDVQPFGIVSQQWLRKDACDFWDTALSVGALERRRVEIITV